MFRPDIEIKDLIKVNQDTAFFNVKGLSLGTASLTFTASTTGKGRATSEPKDIQVRHQITKSQDNHPLKDFHSLKVIPVVIAEILYSASLPPPSNL